MSHFPRWLLIVFLALMCIHLNYWMWDDASIVFGVPVNLLYHIVFSLLLPFVMLVVVLRAWPDYLKDE